MAPGRGGCQASKRHTRNATRQEAVAHFIEKNKKLLAVTGGPRISSVPIFNALESKNRIDGGDRTASGECSGRMCLGCVSGREALSIRTLHAFGAREARGVNAAWSGDFHFGSFCLLADCWPRSRGHYLANWKIEHTVAHYA